METENNVAEFAEVFLEKTHASVVRYLSTDSPSTGLTTFFALDFRSSLTWVQYLLPACCLALFFLAHKMFLFIVGKRLIVSLTLSLNMGC